MLFNSYEFLIFFPIVTALYFALPHRFRWAMLLAASCIFYMYFVPAYILILAFTIVVDYAAGILIENAHDRRRRLCLALSIIANVGVLAAFKYFNFLNGNLAALARFLGWNYPIHALAILLPIGLSFHTFQAMSYTIEVYRGRQKAERHFGIYSLYVMFYPQLVAGPIERPQNLLHQFREEHRFDYDRVTSGLRLMAWGLFMKVVVADRLAILANAVYAAPASQPGPVLAIATIAFAWQIYCDFAGYSNIAIGAARVMGFTLMRNFDSPYHSASIAEFWRRWHISLSSWFKDYVYIPLGGSRVSRPRWCFNAMAVFLLSGLWHGANWTFLAWGALHGLYLVVGAATERLRTRTAEIIGLHHVPSLHRLLRTATAFLLVCFGWIFFRAASLGDAITVLRQLPRGWAAAPAAISQCLGMLRITTDTLMLMIAGVAVVESVHLFQTRLPMAPFFISRPWWVRWPAYVAIVLVILNFGVVDRIQFIYFQF